MPPFVYGPQLAVESIGVKKLYLYLMFLTNGAVFMDILKLCHAFVIMDTFYSYKKNAIDMF